MKKVLLFAVLFAVLLVGYAILTPNNSKPVGNNLSVDRYIDIAMGVVCYQSTNSPKNLSCLEIPSKAELPRPRN